MPDYDEDHLHGDAQPERAPDIPGQAMDALRKAAQPERDLDGLYRLGRQLENSGLIDRAHVARLAADKLAALREVDGQKTREINILTKENRDLSDENERLTKAQKKHSDGWKHATKLDGLRIEAEAKLTAQLEHAPRIIEEDRQMILLAVAELSLSRPGWLDALGRVADRLQGREMFDSFRETSADLIEARKEGK
jgi:hypothetical protein